MRALRAIISIFPPMRELAIRFGTDLRVYCWGFNESRAQASSRTLNIGVLGLTLMTARFALGAMTVSAEVDMSKVVYVVVATIGS